MGTSVSLTCMRWWIIRISLKDATAWAVQEMPPRPADARPVELMEDGNTEDTFTPWYQTEEHTHYDAPDDHIGAHVKAKSFPQAVRRAVDLIYGETPKGESSDPCSVNHEDH